MDTSSSDGSSLDYTSIYSDSLESEFGQSRFTKHSPKKDQFALVLFKLTPSERLAVVNSVIKDQSLLEIAISKNDVDLVAMLILNGAMVSLRNQDQQTPLHYAVKLGNPEIVKLLVTSKWAMINGKDVYFQTPLHLAVIG